MPGISAPERGSRRVAQRNRALLVAAAREAFAEHGARVVEELRSYDYGERSCMVDDPAGHRWELSQTVRDVDPGEWGGSGGW